MSMILKFLLHFQQLLSFETFVNIIFELGWKINILFHKNFSDFILIKLTTKSVLDSREVFWKYPEVFPQDLIVKNWIIFPRNLCSCCSSFRIKLEVLEKFFSRKFRYRRTEPPSFFYWFIWYVRTLFFEMIRSHSYRTALWTLNVDFIPDTVVGLQKIITLKGLGLTK